MRVCSEDAFCRSTKRTCIFSIKTMMCSLLISTRRRRCAHLLLSILILKRKLRWALEYKMALVCCLYFWELNPHRIGTLFKDSVYKSRKLKPENWRSKLSVSLKTWVRWLFGCVHAASQIAGLSIPTSDQNQRERELLWLLVSSCWIQVMLRLWLIVIGTVYTSPCCLNAPEIAPSRRTISKPSI